MLYKAYQIITRQPEIVCQREEERGSTCSRNGGTRRLIHAYSLNPSQCAGEDLRCGGRREPDTAGEHHAGCAVRAQVITRRPDSLGHLISVCGNLFNNFLAILYVTGGQQTPLWGLYMHDLSWECNDSKGKMRGWSASCRRNSGSSIIQLYRSTEYSMDRFLQTSLWPASAPVLVAGISQFQLHFPGLSILKKEPQSIALSPHLTVIRFRSKSRSPRVPGAFGNAWSHRHSSTPDVPVLVASLLRKVVRQTHSSPLLRHPLSSRGCERRELKPANSGAKVVL